MGSAPRLASLAAAAALAAALAAPTPAPAARAKCPAEMASILGRFCIDRWEAGTVEIVGPKRTRPHAPFEPVTGLSVRAFSKKGVVPQAYVSRDESARACEAAGKRLCSDDEWLTACRGKKPTRFPYGDTRVPGRCADTDRVAPLEAIFGATKGDDRYDFASMNDPRLDQIAGGIAKTGEFSRCAGSFRVFDMVGNLHEWTSDPKGTFRGGYYLDTTINGEGCDYVTVAHDATYHDYSTGFRCCASLDAAR